MPDHYSEHLNTLLCKALKRVIWHLYLSQSEKPSETNPPLISQVIVVVKYSKKCLILFQILRLQNNFFRHFHSQPFQNLPHLIELDLQGNDDLESLSGEFSFQFLRLHKRLMSCPSMDPK